MKLLILTIIALTSISSFAQNECLEPQSEDPVNSCINLKEYSSKDCRSNVCVGEIVVRKDDSSTYKRGYQAKVLENYNGFIRIEYIRERSGEAPSIHGDNVESVNDTQIEPYVNYDCLDGICEGDIVVRVGPGSSYREGYLARVLEIFNDYIRIEYFRNAEGKPYSDDVKLLNGSELEVYDPN